MIAEPPAPQKLASPLPQSPPPVVKRSPLRRQQRRQELIYKERRLFLVVLATSFVGTLSLLYITAHANATNEGYQRSELRDAIRAEEAKRLELQTELNRLSSGPAIDHEARKRNLIRTPREIRYLTPTGG